ncbi:MAG: hypothetical protein ACRDGJ_06205 [Candidatus Limnocylindria bacterium]
MSIYHADCAQGSDLLADTERQMGMPIEQQRKEVALLAEILVRVGDTQIARASPGVCTAWPPSRSQRWKAATR